MATLTIPTQPGVAFYHQETNLDGTVYRLTFTYCQREDCYYLSIGLADQLADALSGIKLVSDYGLLRRWNGFTPDVPPGEIIAVSQDPADDSPAGLNDMGEGCRVTLTYITADDPALVGR